MKHKKLNVLIKQAKTKNKEEKPKGKQQKKIRKKPEGKQKEKIRKNT